MKHRHALPLAIALATGLGQMACLHAEHAETASAGALTIRQQDADAYNQSPAGLEPEWAESFARGKRLFRQPWVIPPSSDEHIDGLGPLYNRASCAACHVNNGGGFAPDGPDDEMRAMVVRLGLPGALPGQAPRAHPVYGTQLNERGIPGTPGEGMACVDYAKFTVTMQGGETVELRRPLVRFCDLRYGPLGDGVEVSARIAPRLPGLGLLEAVDEASLDALARRPGPRSGRMNMLQPEPDAPAVGGRFGLKSNQVDLLRQIAAAAHEDMGLSSRLHPDQNCSAVQLQCLAAATGGTWELDDEALADLLVYVRLLGVPARRDAKAGETQRGERLFASYGCSECHVDTLVTAARAAHPLLSGQTIHPYTDLLLHDMGPDLADGRADHVASGTEWRTPPLWGIGLARTVNPRAGFLHDGRARSLLEAVLWHGGEALAMREAFRTAPPDDRAALLRFLESL